MKKEYYENVESLNDLIELFADNPAAFRNRYRNSKRGTKFKEFSNLVDSLVSEKLREEYGEGKFAKLFYDLKHPENKHTKCKICKKQTKFVTYSQGYYSYCGARCARGDPTRISEEKRREGARKRKIKMQALLDDPIRGGEYRAKISAKSKYYGNLPHNRKIRSDRLKNKIKEGTWTPERTASRTNWRIKVDGKKFRSSFEAIYFLYNYYYKKNTLIEYETVRLEYFYDNKRSIYIVDFKDLKNNLLVEIKPKSKIQEPRNKAKEAAGREWSLVNNYKYVILDEDCIKEMFLEMSVSKVLHHEFIDEFAKKYPKWCRDVS